MSITRRHLPHVLPIGHPLFLTFRLEGTLPMGKFFERTLTGKAFLCMDRMLDSGKYGPTWFGKPAAAGCVVEALERAQDAGLMEAHAFVVMPNHVHLLMTAKESVSEALRIVKGASARAVNRVLERRGSLWQSESFDHWVRDDGEMGRIVRYIARNPGTAGVCGRWVWVEPRWRWCVEGVVQGIGQDSGG